MPRPRKRPGPPPRRPHGQGSVTWSEKRRRFRARLPRDGDQPARESWHRSRDEAEAWIARELARAPDSFDPTQSLGAYLNYWYRLHAPRWAPLTQIRYRREISVVRPIRHHALERLRADHVQSLVSSLQARGLSARYTYNIGSLVRRALADAVRWKVLPENVADLVHLPEPDKKPPKAWTEQEVRQVLAAIIGHRFEAAYLLILHGGLRIGEVVALRWDDINWDECFVTVQRGEYTLAKGRPMGLPKRKRVRDVDLPGFVVARLKALRAAGPSAIAPPGRARRDVAYVYVAQRHDGNRWTARIIRDEWSKLVTSLKLTPLRPHGGRHSFATGHMNAGTSLADLAALMGHASPAVTAGTYLSSSRERRRTAASRLGELFSEPKENIEGQKEGQSGA